MPLRAKQSDGYRALYSASADSLRDVTAATRALRGCRLGYFGVLQTWGRDPLVYHPHVHFVVPGGGVQLDENGHAVAWQSTAENFAPPPDRNWCQKACVIPLQAPDGSDARPSPRLWPY